METFAPMILERFIAAMERNGVQLGMRRNVYGLLYAILADAFHKGAIATDPTLGVMPPKCIPDRAVVPAKEYVKEASGKVDFQLAMHMWMMYGCGLRNGEARAVNINKIVADDVHRVTETLYGFRHFFASNCLSHGIPITDAAEWMGHRSIQITYRTYRHLMPGSITAAAKILDHDRAA